MRRAKRDKEIVEGADKATAKILGAIPIARAITRLNMERVAALCREFVCARPALEPTSPALADTGRTRYARFPAAQTILNAYPEVLRIWREAYFAILRVHQPKSTPSSQNFVDVHAIQHLDAGTRAQIHLLEALIKEQKRDNDRLRSIISTSIPAPGSKAKEHEASEQDIALVRRWLESLERPSSVVELDAQGLRVSRHARPKNLIMDIEVLNLLRRHYTAVGSIRS